MSIEVTKYDKGCWQLINQVVQVMLVNNSIWWQVKTADCDKARVVNSHGYSLQWDRIVGDTVGVIEEMDGKSCAWNEDDLVTAGEESEIFGLGGDESGGTHTHRNFKGGYFILVMFSSVCVVTDIGEDLVA
ncbi:hypothetical protein TNCV_283291 [Trichonephila clavipes]|nr:hypothetical protein TNCV_283291 [Trichonephila clavipes]